MIIRSTVATALLLTLAVCSPASAHEATKGGITAAHPWARATPGGVTVGTAYLEIKAAAGVDDRLVAISSPVAGRAEIHNHIDDAGVMRMRRVDGVDLKGGSSFVLKPSGHHVMLMDLKAPLKEGDLIKLTLQFQKAGAIDVEATVEPVGAMGPHGMDHQPGHQPAGTPTMDHSGHGGHAGHGGAPAKADTPHKGHH